MNKDLIKFYPVDNGDTTLIKLTDTTTILFDCKIRSDEKNAAGYKIYDVKADLLEEVERRNGIPYLDMFALTHPDWDHCNGFEEHFYQGDPDDYDDDNKETIVIDELWVTSMIFTNSLTNDDAKAIRREAKRRKALYDEGDESCEHRGNRLRIVGYDGEDKLDNVPHHYPSDIVDIIAGSKQTDFSFFIHAPLKQDLIKGKAEKDKNTISIVVQARFKMNSANEGFATRLIIGGDADHYNWEKILEKTEKHGNQEALKWNLLLSPHHCSWTYYNDVPYEDPEENKDPQDYSVKIIRDYHLEGGQVIASSKLIKDNDDNPPHKPAKDEYIKHIDSEDDFISLAETPKPSEPKPVIFKVTADGPVREDGGGGSTAKKIAAATILGGSSAVSGNWSGEQGF